MKIRVKKYEFEVDQTELEVLGITVSEVLQLHKDGHVNLSSVQHGLLVEMQVQIQYYLN